MAIAAEELSPAAESAVSAAAAGHGKRLAPEVARELRRRAEKPKAAPNASRSSASSGVSLPGPGGAVRAAGRVAKSASTPGGRSDLAFRIVLALGAFIVALELASYLSGRYFSYSLGKGGQKLAGAAQQLDLYPGQSQKLALQKTLPATSAVHGYAGA
jgi:hypothetical protein